MQSPFPKRCEQLEEAVFVHNSGECLSEILILQQAIAVISRLSISNDHN